MDLHGDVMQRRHFLRLGAYGLGAIGLASVATPRLSWAKNAPLAIPTRLKSNPLLQFDGLVDFAAIRPEHVKPAIEFLLQHNTSTIENLTAQKNITWENFYLPLEDAYNKLDRAWSAVGHLHSVKNSDELREVYNTVNKSLTDYDTWYGMYRPLYNAFLQLKKSKAYAKYSKAQKKTIDNALLDFKLSGIELTSDKAKRYGEVVARLSELKTQFGNNVLDANMGWELVIDDKSKLTGLNDLALTAAQKSAESKSLKGYRFGLDYPSYFAIVSYADDRNLRKTMYEAYRTRASDKGPKAGKWDNTPIMNEIMELRLELSKLLGYQTYADYALVKRMAESPKQVLDFLNNILVKAQPKARQEMAELEAYGKKLGLIDKLEPWDISYLSEKQKQDRYNIDKEAVRVYFPEHKVLDGLFKTAKRLFGLDIKEKQGVSVWHDSVRFFELFKDGKHIASFYMDLYTRDNKRGGAWMNSAIERRRSSDGALQLPVAHLVCNFSAPVDGKPALLLHDEVETLFHEFGHCLHQMLTQIEVMAVSGINGVAWDVVEFPSQMLENWTWDKEALGLISEHYQTKAPIPSQIIAQMLAAKNYLAASSVVRQLEYALFDFRLNVEYQKGDTQAIARIRDELKRTVSVINEPEWTRMAHSFNHIFAGGYAAGYYSYLWAEVLAVDAFSRFEQEGLFNAQVGQNFVDTFLGQGGSDSPMAMFRAFMGRDPKPDALLRQRGII